MTRFALFILLVLPWPAAAQVVTYTSGACAVLDADDTPLDYAPCHRLADDCTPESCVLRFRWLESDSLTVVESGTARLRDGFRINGAAAQTPAALAQSDARECVWNSSTERTFCWENGAGAMARATGPAAFATADAPAPAAAKTSPLLSPFAGLYHPDIGTWSCRADQVGMDGGALAVDGNRLLGVESVCTLTRPVPVGGTGAIHVQANCSAEGETYEEDLILHHDGARLSILRAGASSHLLACD